MDNAITKIIAGMVNELTPDQLTKLRSLVSEVLDNYTLVPKKCEILSYEDINQQFLEGFLAWKLMEGKSKLTIKSYNYLLRKCFFAIQKNVIDITEYDVFIYLSRIQKNGASKSYAETIRRALASFYTWMKNKDFIKKNPMLGIGAIKLDKTIEAPFSDAELESIRNSCLTLREKALIEMFYSCGVRVSELCELNIKGIDFINKECIVFGKGAKDRIVYMNEKCVYILKKYIESRKDKNEALFVTSKEPFSRVKPQALRKLLKVIENRCGVDNVHPHRFRKTLATNLLKKGMPVEEVSKILGHESLDTTMIYCSLSRDKVKNNYNILMSS